MSNLAAMGVFKRKLNHVIDGTVSLEDRCLAIRLECAVAYCVRSNKM